MQQGSLVFAGMGRHNPLKIEAAETFHQNDLYFRTSVDLTYSTRQLTTQENEL